MAEGLMRKNLPGMVVISAGLHALDGATVDPFAVDAAWEKGVDIRGHRARSLKGWMVEGADLILTMDFAQRRAIEASHPRFKHRVRRVGEYGDYDIPDPYQKSTSAFQESMLLITQGLEDWSEYLLSTNAETAEIHHHVATQP